MSSRKSKKRIGSTRQRNLGHKAEEREANEELAETITETPDEASNVQKAGVLQEFSTVQHMQPLYSGEMPKCQLDVLSENIEGDQHDPAKTSSERLETGALAELCEAETSTSGKKKRMGSTRRTKQEFKAEERAEEEEKDKSMQMIQEEFNITKTEDQYLKEEPHAPVSDQAHTYLLVKGLTERPRDESPGEEHSLLSELDVKTEAETCSAYNHFPPESFVQCPTPAVNPPFGVTIPQEEGEGLLKQSCFNLFEAKEISSTDIRQDTPERLDGLHQQREDQSHEDVRESDEQRRTEEVILEVSLSIGDISVKEHIKHHVLHRKESQEEMPIMKVDNTPLREMEVESAGIQTFSLQMQDMPQGSRARTTAENISEIKEHLQIFQPGNTNTDGPVIESYDKYGNQNSLQTEQTISINVFQEEDTNSELNVQRPKKRMGSTRKIVKGNKMIEDIGNSQDEAHEMREDTLLNPELTEKELSVIEDTKFRLKTVVNDKFDMVFTVNERGAQLEEAGFEFEEQENKHGNLILDENTESTLIAMDAGAFHSTENITGDSGKMTSTSSSQLLMEGNMDHHHNEIDNQRVTEIAELNAPRLRERIESTHEPLQEISTESFTDKPTVGSLCEGLSPFENDFLASPPMVDHREETVDNSLNLQRESIDCTKTCMSDKDAVEIAEYFNNQSEVKIPSETFSSFEVAEHFKGAFVREDVDYLQKHDEGKAESPESPGDQERQNRTNMAVSEQPEIDNQLSSPSEDPCANCAGNSAEVIGTIPDTTVAPLDVHTESSSLETYSPDIQHCDEVEQGTQAHILISTMKPEVPNISTDISDALHNEQTKQSVSQPLTMESTDTSEIRAQYDDCESAFKLPYHTEEACVKQGASKQKRKMGSTRRTKREQRREETSEVMSTDGDYANEDINIKMNTDTDFRRGNAEEGILETGIIDALTDNEPSTTQKDVGILKMALSCVEQDRYGDCSPSAEVMSSSVLQCNPLEDEQKQDNQHQYLDFTAQQLDGNEAANLEAGNEISILVKETSEGLTTSEAEPFNEAFISKDVKQLKNHEEEKAEISLESLGDQNKENSISLKVSEQAEVVNWLSSPTEVQSPDSAAITVENVRASEKTDSFFLQSGVGTHSETLDPLEQEHLSSSPTPDHIPDITVAPLDVQTGNSSLETYSPDIQHCDEVEQGTQAHILSSTMEPEVPNNGTVASEFLQDGWTKQSDHCESSLRLKHHEKEGSLKQSASRPKRKMGSTRRQKRETNEVHLDEETKSSHETEVMTVVVTEIEVQQEENVQSEQISSREKIHSAGVNTIPVEGFNYQSNVNPDCDAMYLSGHFEAAHIETQAGLGKSSTAKENEHCEKDINATSGNKNDSTHRVHRKREDEGIESNTEDTGEVKIIEEPEQDEIRENYILMIQEGEVGEAQREKDLSAIETQRAVQYDTTEGQERIEGQIENTVPEMSVSASQYPETEKSPSFTRRRKLGSTRRSLRSHQEKTERTHVVMDGIPMNTDTETSSYHANESLDKEEEKRKIRDEENTEVMPCIHVNTLDSPPTSELPKTDQERSNNCFDSKDELIEKEPCILASTITTTEQPLSEDITRNDNHSVHGYTQDDKPVSSGTPPAYYLSSENTLKLTPLEMSDSSEESKPQKKRVGSSRKISQRQHKMGKNESHGEEDERDEDSDGLTNTTTQLVQLETSDVDTHNDKLTDIHQCECSEPASGLHNQPEGHPVTEMNDQSLLGQIEISESSGSTAAEETSSNNLSHDDSQKEPKSMLQKRKMGSSRRGQGLGKRGKGEAEKVDEHMDDTSRQEGGDTAHGALLQNEGSSKESCSVLLKNTQDLPVVGEHLLASVQSSESYLQPLAQAERPDEFIDERVLPASAQSKPSVLSVSSSPFSQFQEDSPNKDQQTSIKKRKMGSTRKNMRRQGEEETSDLKPVHGSIERWNDDTAWDSTISDVEDLPTGPTETATIQKITDTQEQEDTLPHDERAGLGSAGQKKSPQRTRRKMGSRHGGQGYRGICLEGSEDQPVSKRQEKDGSILQGTQENVHSRGVAEKGLSKLTFTGDEERQKVKLPDPSGARSKLDLERKYGPGDTLTSLEEAVMFNIVMVGESSVGKTSFIHQFQNGQFFDDHSATIGVDSCIQTLAVDGKLVKLQIWDTAGQERFHSLTRQVLHKADGLILMYDISSSQTFCAVRKWISCIEEGARSEVLIMLLGNKNDSEERQVLHPEGERLAQEHNFHFMECSAATGHNVPQAMETLARLLKQTVKGGDEEHVALHKKPLQKKSGCC